MSDWIPLDTEALERGAGTVTRIGRSRVEEQPSPYDVPEALRATFDPASERLTIELKYLGDEPCRGAHATSRVDLSLGRNSHRVYGITVDLQGAPQPARGVLGLVNEALDHLTEKYKGRAANYSLARTALRESADRLLGGILSPTHV